MRDGGRSPSSISTTRRVRSEHTSPILPGPVVLKIRPSRLAELEQHLALYFTGFARAASEIAQEQVRVTPQRKHELDLMLQLVDEGEAIVSKSHRSLDEFGRLLHEGWQIKRSLTQKITNSSIDEI